MSKIKSTVMGGVVGIFTLAFGAVAFAETVAPAPFLLAAPAEAFPVNSEAPGNSAKNDSTVDALSVAQAEPAADRFVSQAPPIDVAPPRPVAPSALGKTKPKTSVHAQKRADRIAFNENNSSTPSRPHGKMLMIGVSY
ncbi:hypothetical protein [uncultured Rhodoblastus sp.]|uniref:hypothetical protein n=1 Tax=uncultured Rhodoblastus sp. TaxID=543037 RepID=UPI0025FA4D7E|nr:hypothetical protein [uncultured Rhodoblastus sp.]